MSLIKSLNKEQKAVIVWFLVKIAEADGDINTKEEQILAQAIELIGFDSSDKETENVSLKVSTYPLIELIRILSTLNEFTKEWFAVTTHSLIVCDGSAKESEVKMAIYVCSQIGISEKEYYNIVKKSIAIYNKMKK